jgi:hypothetical protein
MRLSTWACGLVGLLSAGGCGEGLRDGQGEREVTQIVGPEGGEVVLGQARLVVRRGLLSKPTTVALRRVPVPEKRGPIGPAFELSVQGGSFNAPPVLELAATPPEGVPGGALRIGFHKAGGADYYWWLPFTSSTTYDAAARTIRTDATAGFPDGTTIQFGAMLWCGNGELGVDKIDKCAPEWECGSGVCQ